MKVFLPNGSRASRTVYVQPGRHCNDYEGWFVSDGHDGFEKNADGTKLARTFGVKFVNGVAEVDDKRLAKYMIEEGHASKTQAPGTPVPPKVVDYAPEERVRPPRRVYTKTSMG